MTLPHHFSVQFPLPAEQQDVVHHLLGPLAGETMGGVVEHGLGVGHPLPFLPNSTTYVYSSSPPLLSTLITKR